MEMIHDPWNDETILGWRVGQRVILDFLVQNDQQAFHKSELGLATVGEDGSFGKV
jgi:hypothetical protein